MTAPTDEPRPLLPNTFRCLDREWTVRFTDRLLARILDATQLDLWKSIEIKDSPLVALGEDERKLRTAVLIAIEEQIAAHGVDRDELVDHFHGDVFDEAFVAVQGGLMRFFSARRRDSLRVAIDFLEKRGQAELNQMKRATEAGIEEGVKAGEQAIAKIRTTIREAMVQETHRRATAAIRQASPSDGTSSNAAAIAESTPAN